MYKFVFHYSTIPEKKAWELIFQHLVIMQPTSEPCYYAVPDVTKSEIGRVVEACINIGKKVQVSQMNATEIWFEFA